MSIYPILFNACVDVQNVADRNDTNIDLISSKIRICCHFKFSAFKKVVQKLYNAYFKYLKKKIKNLKMYHGHKRLEAFSKENPS